MTKALKIIFVLISIVFLGYLILPSPDFPAPPPDSVQSQEPADLETPLRRSYFTKYSRDEVISWYKIQFKWGLRLNYPPEEAQTLIRDQTHSSFLEEIVHPFRESIYINGLNLKGSDWNQKIIIRYVPSSVWVRVAVFAATQLMIIILFKAFKSDIIRIWKKKT